MVSILPDTTTFHHPLMLSLLESVFHLIIRSRNYFLTLHFSSLLSYSLSFEYSHLFINLNKKSMPVHAHRDIYIRMLVLDLQISSRL